MTLYMPHYGFRTDNQEIKNYLDGQKNKSQVIMKAVVTQIQQELNIKTEVPQIKIVDVK